MLREVETENGRVRGIEAADPRITAFKGIPFAAPPVGENRWRAPQPAADWPGVREAYRFGPIAMQDTPGLGDDIYCREWHVDSEIAMSEDCLYLNVWTGAKKPGERLPVVVWFYGGSLQWGYPAEMEMDGERLARRGIVVVTVNYRLNVLGFLAHPELTQKQPEAPTNFGSLDQQAGIRWVARNIAAFGGDPDNITIAGQSAGGGSVLSQMACPDNRGLFKKAVIMSAMIRSPYEKIEFTKPEKLENAEENGRRFFGFLGVTSLEEARKLDAVYIRDKYAEYAQAYPRMYTVLDRQFCVGDPLRMFLEGESVPAPVMAGNTSDEFPGFLTASSRQELIAEAERCFGSRAGEFLAFPEALESDGQGHYAVINEVECTARSVFKYRRKNENPCYYYCFMPDIPGEDAPGTFHSVDLWFFFETLAKSTRPFVGRHYDLARQMCNYWANFIKTGDPNGFDADGSPLPRWLPYTGERAAQMRFTSEGAQLCMDGETPFKRFIMETIRDSLILERGDRYEKTGI